MKFRETLNKVMDKIKEDNPKANWGNLITGIGILVLIAFFSVWYFGKTSNNTGLNQIINSVKNGNIKTEVQGTTDTSQAIKVEVLSGEGLWQVAERVCGDGEKYNYMALANNLNLWSEIKSGQSLVVDCGPSN
ncbi:hypothetical protein A3H26_01875 [candidate division WWE3 bacterium RIFCSPLOWO2_12_FULL_36_10]|uniref:LysM domain-containing protein n=1 Tax=candidate division WWE3 bacterium RIFCSPLOWO2_12_FULL_36_10 TaxID=1802630 RepID=A0A1F4VH80_UNCKA|nr:MAG: hypothetical protein A3H26_01875 [candidate division WWE3 bacterium RIFCSPLOWO2_12_FULL_36_10]